MNLAESAVIQRTERRNDAEMRELLAQVAQRDKAAFRALYHALYPPLLRYLYRLIHQLDDVEELINDVMWVVWEKADEFRGEAQVTTWVLGIATLKSHRWRQHKYRRQELIDALVAEEEVHPDIDVDDRSLTQSLAKLSAEHRETLELAYYFGYSCEEVAGIMGCPVGTVKTRLYYARKRLQQMLGPHYMSCGNAL